MSRTTALRIVAIMALALVSLCVDATAQRQGRGRGRDREGPREPVVLEHFDYAQVEFDAPSLERANGQIGVYLPKSYAEDDAGERTYPWVLWLHGLNEDGARFHYEGGAKVLDQLRDEGKIPEFILVAPSAPRRTIYANGESDGDAEDYIVKDVTDYVEDHYRVSTERNGRAIMGVSMGGMGAMRMAFKTPDRFIALAAHSSAAFAPDPTKLDEEAGRRVERTVQWMGLGSLLGEPIDPEKWARYIPSAMLEKMEAKDLDGLKIYFDAGTADRYQFAEPNEQLHEMMEGKGIKHSFTMVEGGGHSWGSGSLQKQLVFSLQFVGKAFEKSAASEPR